MKNTQIPTELTQAINYSFEPAIQIWESVKFIAKNREESELENALNYTLILQCCAYTEGLICKVLRTIIDYRRFKFKNAGTENEGFGVLNYLEKIENDIDQAQWKNYNDLYYQLFNEKLTQKITSITWEAIDSMFSYRNTILHGNNITIEYNQVQESSFQSVEIKGKHNKLFSFFEKNKLIEKPMGFITPINNKILDFFIAKTESFEIEFANSLVDEFEKSLAKIGLNI